MSRSFIVPKAKRERMKKVLAGFLALSLNLSMGGLAALIPVHVAHAADSGFIAPNATISAGGSIVNPGNAWASDNAYAEFSNSGHTAQYGFPDLAIPGATIDGIEVMVEGHNPTGTRDISVALYEVGDGFTSVKVASLPDSVSSDTTVTLGSPTDKWGESWEVSDFSDANFKIEVRAVSGGSQTAKVDQVKVKVYYTVDACNAVTTYEKTGDFSDARVSINYESSDNQIDVSAHSGYVVTQVWLDISGDGIGGYVLHASGPVDNYNPSSGTTINEAKVLVKMVCDGDNDGILDSNDNCPSVLNSDQTNTDGDSMGDACDTDDDNDGDLDGNDNCPVNANADQKDSDADGTGNACDDTPTEPEGSTIDDNDATCTDGRDNDDDGLTDEADNNCDRGLTVGTTGTGVGNVSGNGVDCGMGGSTCGATYDYGTEITLTALADTSSTFSGWSGACSGTGVCSFVMSMAQTVTAAFTLNPEEPKDVCPLDTGIQEAGPCTNDGNATIHAYKVVCDAESDLPNWSGSGTDINANTAANYVAASEGRCQLESGWEFQWAPTNDSDPWTTSSETDASGHTEISIPVSDVDGSGQVWMREVLPSGYIPFSNELKTGASVSAEMWCDGDVLNYDNLDYARGLSDTTDGYCVAFNVPVEVVVDPEQCDQGQHWDEQSEQCVNDTPEEPTCDEGQELVESECVDTTPTCDQGQHWDEEEDACVNDQSEPEAPVCNAEVELVQNGGFENTEGGFILWTDSTLKWLGTIFPIGEMEGPNGLEVQDGCCGTPHNGNNLAELDGYHPTEIYQTISTIPGKEYSLSYWFSPRPSPFGAAEENILGVSVNDVSVNTYTVDGTQHEDTVWTQYTHNFVASGSETKIAFKDLGLDDESGGEGTYLDDVSMRCVGDPVVEEPEEETPVTPPGGGGGSGSFDYWGCTNPSALNYNALANRDDNSCQIGGGGGGSGGSAEPQGEVLGAATVEEEDQLPPSCSAYLTTYMKLGSKKNEVEEVKKLQTFLNEFMGANLPVTGVFGPLTKTFVKKLQKEHKAEIIQPWLDAGEQVSPDGTGVVYKTTRRFINLTKCATLNEPMPNLVGDSGL